MTARSHVEAASTAAHRRLRGAGRALFGDRRGLVVFLACLCFFGLYWRAGQFITDTSTITEALAAVMDGRLWLDRAGEGSFFAPGAVRSDGLVYGRNYAQVFLSVPFLVAVEAVDRIADLRVALAALWHLALLALVVQLGRLYDARRLADVGASAVVVASFLLNVAVAEQFLSPSHELIALQIGTLLAAALLSVVVYRLVALFHDAKAAVVAGLATGLVLPVGFWASIPKRHALSALLLAGILYAFARSRTARHDAKLPVFGPVPAFRPMAYALVGILAWLHAAEAIFAFVPLVLVDLPTAPSNDRRTLAVVAAALVLSMVPFFLTNFAISGNPIRPPRTLPRADTVGRTADSLSSEGFDLFEQVPGGFVLEGAVWLSTSVTDQVSASLAMVREPEALYRTYVRSGSLEIAGSKGLPEFRAVNLSVLESVPLFGALVAVLATAGGALRRDARAALSTAEPTDLLAAGLVVSFVLLFTQRLPVHVQVTVRYLLPVYPLGLFLVVRHPRVRRLLTHRWEYARLAYAGGVLFGTQILLAYVVWRELTVAEATQLHAVLALATAAFLAATLAVGYVDDRSEPLAAVALGLAAAAGTAFVLLTGLAYFSFIGEFVLPVSGAVSDAIGRI